MGKSYTITGEDFSLTAKTAGKYILTLSVDGVERCSVGRVRCGKFTELGALEKKFRVHREAANLTCGIDSSFVLPFGCEYEISRNLECGDGALDFSTDVAALNFGRVGDLALEELFFFGEAWRASLRLFGENSSRDFTSAQQGELFRGALCPVALRVDFADGATVEYQVGTDLWRHNAAAAMTGVNAEFALIADEKGMHLFRNVLRYDEGVESEKRPWRFNTVIAWRSASAKPYVPTVSAEIVEGCPLAGAWRREVRRRVRRTTGDFLLGGVSPVLCSDAAHLDRAGKGDLPHNPAQEKLATYRWANRLLKKTGGVFTIENPENFSLLDTVLSCPPRELLPEVEL